MTKEKDPEFMSLVWDLQQAEEENTRLMLDKATAYYERNCLVALLAHMFPAGIAKTAIEGWDKEWHNCVYIDTPLGQLSWHYHDNEAMAFADLPPYWGKWDGHTTNQKYERVTALGMLDWLLVAEPKGVKK